MTTVCNVKVSFIRPKGFDNLKLWCEDDNNVYIGRRGIVFIKNEESGGKERYPTRDSKWANPFKLGKGKNAMSREESIEKYEEYICQKIQEDPETYNLSELKGKNLGCWCCPEKCHGEVLKKLVEKSDKKMDDLEDVKETVSKLEDLELKSELYKHRLGEFSDSGKNKYE